MHPFLRPPQWSELDTQEWLTFLQGKVGQNLLSMLCAELPGNVPGRSAEYTLGKIDAHRELIERLKDLTKFAAKETQSVEYPPLDDETAWDGSVPKKLI